MKVSRENKMIKRTVLGFALAMCLMLGVAMPAAADQDPIDEPTAPVVTIGSGSGALTNSTSAEIAFTVDQEDSTTECRLDSTDDLDWEACTSPVALSDLTEGSHSFQVRATDLGGNVGDASTFNWQIDLTPPVVSIASGPDAHTNLVAAEIAFTIDDDQATAECRLDSSDEQDWNECSSPFESGNLADGDHLFEVRATDSSGNTGVVASHAWNLDTDSPEVTIDTAPPATNNSINAVFGFSADEAGTLAECRLDPEDENDPWSSCESPVAYTDLADGPHRFEVRVTDLAGNKSPTVGHDWEVSTVKPEAVILSGPASPTGDDTATFGFASANTDATFECRVDPEEGSEWEPCTSPVDLTDLTHGDHRFEVRAFEADQGTGPVADFEWSIDLVEPTVEITTAPAAISGTSDPVFGFVADEPGTTAECRVDPVDSNSPWQTCNSPTAYSGLADGNHRFEVRVTDPVGRVSQPVHYEWIVETTPPEVTIESGPESPTTFIAAEFTFNLDNPNAFSECRLDGGDWNVCESGVKFDQLADGTHEFEVRGVGYGAGPGPIQSQTWVVDTIVPTLVITAGPASRTNRDTADFTFESSKPGYSFTCQLDSGAVEPCSSPLSLTGITAGEHSLSIEMHDSEDQIVDSNQWVWTVLADRPVSEITSTPAAVSGSATAVFEFESDLAEAKFECQIDGGSWSSCNSPAAFTSLVDGAHSFKVRAALADSGPGAAAEYDWSVDTVAPDIRITGGPGASTNSTSASFGIVTDDSTAAISCRLDEGAWTVCADPFELTNLSDGEHVLRVRGVDEVGNTGFDRYDWKVDSTPPIVTISSAPQAKTDQVEARFGFVADDPQATFECRVDGGEWKSCSSVHEITVKPGSHEFAVRASDSLGNVSEPVVRTWEVTASTLKGLVPTVNFKRNVKLDKRGTARVAMAVCPEGRCQVTVRRTVNLVVGKKRFKAKVLASRNPNRAARTEVRVTRLLRARKALRQAGKPGLIKLKITVVSDNGKRRSVTRTIRLR